MAKRAAAMVSNGTRSSSGLEAMMVVPQTALAAAMEAPHGAVVVPRTRACPHTGERPTPVLWGQPLKPTRRRKRAYASRM